jgi:hypothetical protein
MNTKLDNQQQLLDSRDENFHRLLQSRHEALTTMLAEVLHSRPLSSDPPPLSSSGNPLSILSTNNSNIPTSSHQHLSSHTTTTTPISIPSTPPPFSLSPQTTFPLFHQSSTPQPTTTSTTTPIHVSLPNHLTHISIPQPIIFSHNTQQQQSPYSQPNFSNPIPFGNFQPQPIPYTQPLFPPHLLHSTN